MKISEDLIKYLDTCEINVKRDGDIFTIDIYREEDDKYATLINGTLGAILADWCSRVLILEKRWLSGEDWTVQELNLAEYLFVEQFKYKINNGE